MNRPAHAVGFQYQDPAHETDTALAGMWLFLASEALFFGGLFLSYIFCRHANLEGFEAGARETAVGAGAVNTLLLVTSSLIYSMGAVYARVDNRRGLIRCLLGALALGAAFIAVKFGWEWPHDFAEGLFPAAADFKIVGPAAAGARLFFFFYFAATGLHGLHMIIGVGLVIWVLIRARRGDFSRGYHTPVIAVGLYWSFVDMVWLILYPLIYLLGRG